MQARVSSSLFVVLSLASATGVSGCGVDTPDTRSNPVPVIDVALNRSFQTNRGLVTGLDNFGIPVRAGNSMDATVNEARRFYDTLKSPSTTPQDVDYPDPFTGAPATPHLTAPMTFDEWKRTFNFPVRSAGESVTAYRARIGAVVYYNKNELGLGRELACSNFPDGVDSQGQPLTGIACFVTNYGTAFRDLVNSLPLAAEGLHSKNTVCISYRPSLDPDYQVQFYTYNGDGLRREYAQLDTLGPRPLPQVCMNCHGGSYDSSRHLAKFARFLPLDPNVVLFSDTGDTTRAAQEERIRAINAMQLASPLTPMQRTMLDSLYGGKITVAGTVSHTDWAPTQWGDSDDHRQLFHRVLWTNCGTCHAAMEKGPGGDTLAIYTLFQSPTLLDAGLPAQLCGNFTMPNSQATLLNFWEPSVAPATIAGKTYTTDADALLATLGMTPDQCAKLDEMANCNRGANPEELCGNAYSGRGCNRVTGKCEPYMRAPRNPGDPNGICKLDGTRGCAFPSTCQPARSKPAAGLESYDGVCVP